MVLTSNGLMVSGAGGAFIVSGKSFRHLARIPPALNDRLNYCDILGYPELLTRLKQLQKLLFSRRFEHIHEGYALGRKFE